MYIYVYMLLDLQEFKYITTYVNIYPATTKTTIKLLHVGYNIIALLVRFTTNMVINIISYTCRHADFTSCNSIQPALFSTLRMLLRLSAML